MSKQLLPVYDKPMIYYPMATLMMAGIREILIISTPQDLPRFQQLLSDGRALGLRLTYAAQPEPKGLAEAFVIGADFVGDQKVALVLGDNIFHGPDLGALLRRKVEQLDGCTLFTRPVDAAHRYGIAELDPNGKLVSLEEKPPKPRSNLAVTGLYLYDNDVLQIARHLRPSLRGELEITDVNREYLRRSRARVVQLGPGYVWYDTGTHDTLAEAAQFVRQAHRDTGDQIACIEEIALRHGYITAAECYKLGLRQEQSPYGRYVIEVAERFAEDLPWLLASAS